MDDNLSNYVARAAQSDFERARRRAFISDIVATLKGDSNWLISFEEVQKMLPMQGQFYSGLQQVPISQIVGSVDRYRDFDRRFLPTQTHTRRRWESVDRATLNDVVLPPVQLYKVGGIYFVKDGNHRVSVAKEKGAEYIDAEVIDCPTRVQIPAISDQRELIQLAEFARFLEQTKLDKLRENVNIRFTSLGRYDVLIEHISAHRWYMGIDQKRPVEWEEAVLDWYDNIYLPLAKVIEDNKILQDFPNRTAGDLYLWIMDHRWYLREESGHDVGMQTAALSYDANYMGWTRKVVRTMRRLQMAATRPLVVSAQRIARAIKAAEED